MVKRTTRIDEEEMRRLLGSEGPLLDGPPSTLEPLAAVQAIPEEPEKSEVPCRSTSVADFERLFLSHVDVRYRAALYVSAETKRKILDVVRKIGDEQMTVTSYVENILRHHLETYRSQINRMHRERNHKNLL